MKLLNTIILIWLLFGYHFVKSQTIFNENLVYEKNTESGFVYFYYKRVINKLELDSILLHSIDPAMIGERSEKLDEKYSSTIYSKINKTDTIRFLESLLLFEGDTSLCLLDSTLKMQLFQSNFGIDSIFTSVQVMALIIFNQFMGFPGRIPIIKYKNQYYQFYGEGVHVAYSYYKEWIELFKSRDSNFQYPFYRKEINWFGE